MQRDRKRWRWLLVLAGLLGASVAVQADDPAVRASPRKDKWWMDRHEAFLKRAKEGNINVLFLGDSITQGWGDKGPLVI
jgi:beta-glucosidase